MTDVFIVDDDRIVCHSLNVILKKYDYNVFVFHSAKEFLDQFNDSIKGILLLDQSMPEMTGIELLKEINKGDLINSLKVIFITAVYDAIHDQAIENGALKVFEKPFDPKELIEFLNKVH